MVQTFSIKIGDKTGLNKREEKILQASVLNLAAMASMAVVVKKGQGGEGMVFNPLEDENYFCGTILIYEKAIDPELAEDFKIALESRFTNFFKMCEIDMTIEVDFH